MQKFLFSIFLVVIFSLPRPVLSETLTFGILPVIDTLPLQVAVKEGFFEEQGLDVTLVPFMSAMERNTAVHSHQIDGFFGDLIATILLVDKGVDLRLLTVSYRTNPEQRMFGLVLSPEFEKAPAGGSISVAISKASIIEYLLTYIAPLPGANRYSYEEVEIKQMPIRLQMLLAGRMDSALLPEPLLTLAESRGATVLATDQSLDMPLTVLNISGEKAGSVKPFMKAYEKAVSVLNKEPAEYRELMARTSRIPKPLIRDFPMYTYPEPKIPEEKEVMQVQDWMLKKGLIEQKIPYRQMLP